MLLKQLSKTFCFSVNFSGSFASKALRIPPGSYFAVGSAIAIYALGSLPVVNVKDSVIACRT